MIMRLRERKKLYKENRCNLVKHAPRGRAHNAAAMMRYLMQNGHDRSKKSITLLHPHPERRLDSFTWQAYD